MCYTIDEVFKVDQINEKIIAFLKEDARMSWQEIGRELHLSGQAVAARVQKMIDERIIDRFTIAQTKKHMHFIIVYMQNSNFDAFESFIHDDAFVQEAYKVTGDGCYQLVCASDDNAHLEIFLEKLLRYGRYKIVSKLRKVK